MKSQNANPLQNATSPYLLQHAHNPVYWYMWGDEALEKAQREDKPILLSIGYSACHWCHVMAHECFENEEIAAIQNEFFINIKVDREERPDLDEIYMHAVQMMSGRGGWPLNVFLTPDLKPFFGGTYFPPTQRYQMPSWPELLKNIAHVYKTRREEITQSTEKIFSELKQMSEIPVIANVLGEDIQDKLSGELLKSFDRIHGGFGAAPKFPHAQDLIFLMREGQIKKNESFIKPVLFTLEKMALGGMYDQLGGGFHRYSTDERWLIPHFEKMLYDNALLLKAYTEAFVHTKNSFFRNICEQTVSYVAREMTSPEGAFYSAQDADSAGEEGTYFVWTPKEIMSLLGEKDGTIICDYYGVTESGNFENKTSALWRSEESEVVAARHGVTEEELVTLVERARVVLFSKRDEREKPALDDKIVMSWNGLMIGALSRAGFYFKNNEWIAQAQHAVEFIFSHFIKGDAVYRIYSRGRASVPAFLEDFSYLISGLLDLFEATGDFSVLKKAVWLQGISENLFDDEEHIGFYFTRPAQKDVIARSRSAHDGATPSAGSMAVMNLLKLAVLTGTEKYRERAQKYLRQYEGTMNQIPRAFTQMILARQYLQSKAPEIVVVGDPQSPEYSAFVDFFRENYFPGKTLVLLNHLNEDTIREFPIYADKIHVKKPTVFLCRNRVCEKPIEDVGELLSYVVKI